jgi:hypothetical protein
VPWNLEIMTHAANCKKHNKFKYIDATTSP